MKAGLMLSDKSKAMLRKMPGVAVPAMHKGMVQGMILAEGTAKSPYLSGKALNRRTGRLRGSVAHSVTIKGDRIIGRIGTNVKYGRIHELGFKGPMNIKGHTRVIRQAFGKAIEPTTVFVKPHTRQVDIPRRSFLRPALDDNLGNILRIITNRITEAFDNI
jgi:phage gpG-like protein